MGHLALKSKIVLDNMKEGEILQESDWSILTKEGNFVQFEYVKDESKPRRIEAKPGIYTIIPTQMGLMLDKTSFTSDAILKDFINTKESMDKIDKFFNSIDIYKRYGRFPKRGALFYGPAGTGKTTLIAESCKKYAEDGKTFILIWHTDKIEAGDVKHFIKRLEYVDGVEKMILVAEDIGGIEIDQARIRSESALLSLLDNQEQTFTIPVYIAATTNYPENFMGNLTNRPNRFDDKIRVGHPPAAARVELLKFYDKDNLADEEALKLMASDKCKEFTPAHIGEVVIRSAIYQQTITETIKQILEEVATYDRGFAEKAKGRFGLVE